MSRDSKRRLVEEIGNLSREGQNLTDRVDDALAELMGINRTDMRCVDILDRMGPMTAGQLATESGLTTGAVTTMIDRIERAGYARRVPDPGDRRRVMVEATPQVMQDGAEAFAPVFEFLRAMEEQYSAEELEVIRRFLRQGNDLSRSQISHLAKLAEKSAVARKGRG